MALVEAYLDRSGYTGPLGSTDEWAELGAWVSALPDDYPALKGLYAQGWCDTLQELEDEVDRALEDHPPDETPALDALAAAVSGRAKKDRALAVREGRA